MSRTVLARSVKTSLVLLAIGIILVLMTKVPVVGPVFPVFFWGQIFVLGFVGVSVTAPPDDWRRLSYGASFSIGEACLIAGIIAGYDGCLQFCGYLGFIRDTILVGMITLDFRPGSAGQFGWICAAVVLTIVVGLHWVVEDNRRLS
jgi:hypothetical protein